MTFQSLYRRYRPRRFAEVKGQEHVVRALSNAVRDDTVAHAYLFSGPRGTGKTSTARILAKALNCVAPVDGEPCCECPSCLAVEAGTSLDVLELDAASNNGVDAMRDLISRVSLATGGRTKVYIVDEVHMLTAAASNALLKTLEEPPGHVVFVLATTDPQKVLPTIRSRTQHFDFRLLPAATLAEHLRWVAADAGLEVSDQAVDLAVRRGAGSARDALSALDLIVASGGVVEDDAPLDEIVEALCERDTGRALLGVAAACAAGRDPRHVADALLAHLRDVFLSVMAKDIVALPDVALERVSDQGRRLGAPAAVRALDALGEAVLAMREAPDPRIALEVALVRVTRPEIDASPAALLERIERLERASRSGDQGKPAATPPPSSPAATPPPSSSPETPGSGREAARRAVADAAAPGDDSAVRRDPAAGGRRPALGGVRGASTSPPSPTSPPAATAPTASTEAAGDRAPLPSREELTLLWADRVLGGLRPVAKGVLAAGRFIDVDPDAAVFAMPSDVMRDKAEVRRADMETALAAAVGRPVPVRFVVDPGVAEAPGRPVTEPASPQVVGDDEIVDPAELRDAPADPRTGIDRLADAFPGAEIVED